MILVAVFFSLMYSLSLDLMDLIKTIGSPI